MMRASSVHLESAPGKGEEGLMRLTGVARGKTRGLNGGVREEEELSEALLGSRSLDGRASLSDGRRTTGLVGDGSIRKRRTAARERAMKTGMKSCSGMSVEGDAGKRKGQTRREMESQAIQKNQTARQR